MDPDIARWLLDFLVRQPISDSTLNHLIATLPISNTDSNLKKLLLLRKIESEISNGSVSDDILSLLEHIEEQYYREKVDISGSMKRAYCAVAVHCTVKCMDENNVGEYSESVKKIWRRRVGGMKKYGNVGLVSDELISWEDDIEKAVWNVNVRMSLLKKWKRVDAVEAVRVFLKDAREKIGPSFLELVAGTLSADALKELFGINIEAGTLIGNTLKQVSETEANTSSKDTLKQVSEMEIEDTEDVQKETVQHRRKVCTAKQYKKFNSGTSRGVEIVDNDELADASPHNNYGCLSSPEVTTLQVNLRSSISELQEMVKDPLPDALEMAKNVSFNTDSVDKNIDVMHAEKRNLKNKGSTHQTNATLSRLMERNDTARTYEWDETSDGSIDLVSRLHLSSPKRRVVSPLKKHEPFRPLRRKRKLWSNLEEDTLRKGVQKYGMGNWKFILDMYRDIFDERTEVDLKDKWRNMTT